MFRRKRIHSAGNKSSTNIIDFGPPFDDLKAVNKYFASVATDPAYDKQVVLDFVRPADCNEIKKFYEFSVFQALQHIKCTAQGCDPIPYWFLKHCALELTPVITHLFNLILFTGISPDSWKHSIITPIPKVNPPSSLSDLRPISVTPILSRVFERLFVKWHLLHSLPKSLLEDQFAFRPTGSTTAALTYIFHNAASLLERCEYVQCFLVDFSKAFDTVSHSVLLEKLTTYRVLQYVTKWITNFLTDRTQSI